MNRITQAQLNNLVKVISDLTDIPNSRTAAEKAGKKEYLKLEYAPIYGGYRLVLVEMPSFCHLGAFGGNGSEARRTAKEMYAFLTGIIEGIKYTNSSIYGSVAGSYNGPMTIKGNTYE